MENLIIKACVTGEFGLGLRKMTAMDNERVYVCIGLKALFVFEECRERNMDPMAVKLQ